MAQPGYDPYAGSTDAGWFGSNIVKGIGKAAKKVAHAASKAVKSSVFKAAAEVAQTALRNAGPIGMAANAALEATKAGLSGKNIGNIVLAAAHGAAPSGINEALIAGEKIARGDNVLKTALSEGVHAYLPQSAERFAYSVAADALKKGASKSDLGAARRAMATEGQRRAFDSAVGTLALAHKNAGKGQPMASGQPTARPHVSIIPTRNRSPVQMRQHAISKRNMLRFQKLSPRAANFIRSRVPHAPMFALLGRDTGALSSDGASYVVEAGDYAGKIAQKLVGVASRYLELLAANPQKPTVTVGGVKNFKTLFAGEKLNVPTSWRVAAVSPLPVSVVPSPTPSAVPTTTRPTLRFGAGTGQYASQAPYVKQAQQLLNAKNGSQLTVDGKFGSLTLTATKSFQKARGLVVDGVIGPKTWAALDAAPVKIMSSATVSLPGAVPLPVIAVPTIGQSATDTSSTIQAKAILVAWAKSDGMNEPGFPDYGVRPEDMSTTFGPRDMFVAASFERWMNRTQGANLLTDGSLTPELVNALRVWAEKRAATAMPSPGATAAQNMPGAITSPGIIPSVPSTAIVAAAPPGTPTAATPSVVVNAKPAPAGSKPNALVMAGGGGVLGFAIGGIPGALIGAAAGAIASA